MLKWHLPLASQLRCWLELHRYLRFSELHWHIEENWNKNQISSFQISSPWSFASLSSLFAFCSVCSQSANLHVCPAVCVSKLLCCSVRHVSPLRAVALGFLDASQRRAASAPSRPWCSASARSAAFTDLRGSEKTSSGRILIVVWVVCCLQWFVDICRYLSIENSLFESCLIHWTPILGNVTSIQTVIVKLHALRSSNNQCQFSTPGRLQVLTKEFHASEHPWVDRVTAIFCQGLWGFWPSLNEPCRFWLNFFALINFVAERHEALCTPRTCKAVILFAF